MAAPSTNTRPPVTAKPGAAKPAAKAPAGAPAAPPPKNRAAAISARLKNVRPNRGFGMSARWPGESTNPDSDFTLEVNSIIVGVEIKRDDKFSYYAKDANKKSVKHEVPAFSLRFQYNTTEEDGTILKWPGDKITVAWDIDALPETERRDEGGKIQSRMEALLGRIVGHWMGLFGYDEEVEIPDIDTILGQIEQFFKEAATDNRQIEALVRIVKEHFDFTDERTKKEVTKWTKREFIQNLVSGPVEGADATLEDPVEEPGVEGEPGADDQANGEPPIE